MKLLKMKRIGAAVLLAAGCLAGTAAAQSFTIEQVMSAPYLTDLTAAPQTDQIAWVENLVGVRNIWVASGPDFTPRKLTNYTEDDGQVLSGLHFTPAGDILLYVRGGNANRAGEFPNPTSHPDGTEQAIWAVKTAGGLAGKVILGHNPVPAPDGSKIVCTNRGQIFSASLTPPGTEDESSPSPNQLFHARGGNGSPRWSPDGKKLAFVSARRDHSFIGVFDLEARRITWIAPGVDRDALPVWSPDGSRLAFIRMPGARKHELRNITGGTPFALWVADVATGTAQEIWHSPADDGGFAQYYPAEPLRWTRTNHLLFYSEHEGWMHIYRVSPDGGPVVDLTPGAGEAEHSAVSPDGRFLYYSSNAGDIDRRHIRRTEIATAHMTPLTGGTSLATEPIVTGTGSWLVFRRAGATTPPAIVVQPVTGGESKAIAPRNMPEAFPRATLVTPTQAIFKAADGLEIHGQLFLPNNAHAGDKRPALIFMHGGPIRQMLLGWHYRGYYANAYAMNQYLANQGYVVLAVNYRSGIGYGRAFRRAENQGPRGASEYQDILAAGKYLQQRPEVDPARIGLWGGSYGGYLTAMGLARDSDLFAAGVDLHGVHDWAFRATDFSPGGGWAIQGEALLESAYKSSPVADLTYWSSPVLFIHGDDDRNVLFQQTTDLVQRLRERKVHIETLIFPDEVHGFLRYESWRRAYRATADFFDRFLKNRPADEAPRP